MPEGYDHDFEVPPGAFRTIFSRLATRWPEGIAQLYGGELVPFAAVTERGLDTLGDGFMAWRNDAARVRSDNEGGFVDADGESFLNIFLVHCDTTRLEIDIVFDNNGSPAFSLVVHEAVGHGISEALRGKPSREWPPMDRAWRDRTLDTLYPHLPGGAVGRERAHFIALACWHRVRYEQTPHLTYTQPPGRLTVVDGRLGFEPDDAGPSPRTRPWG